VSLDSLKQYLEECSDDEIWKPFYDDANQVDEFNKMLLEIESSKTWPQVRNQEKGKLLESLTKFIMGRFTLIENITENKSTTDNELDIFVDFNQIIPMPFFCKIKSRIICECKNWKSKPVDVGMVSKLVEVCKKNDAGLGIFISLKGLSGNGWRYAEGKRRKLYLSEGIPIISFTVDEIQNLKLRDNNLFTMIKHRMQALIDEIDYTGGNLEVRENEEDFLTYLHENINCFEKLKLITTEEKNSMLERISIKYGIKEEVG
jgi:hypothetical protein